jgi:hypothetical protein
MFWIIQKYLTEKVEELGNNLAQGKFVALCIYLLCNPGVSLFFFCMYFFSGQNFSLKISTIQELPGGWSPYQGFAMDPRPLAEIVYLLKLA